MAKVSRVESRCSQCGRTSKQLTVIGTGDGEDFEYRQKCPHCGYEAADISKSDYLTDEECLALLEPEVDRKLEELDLYMKDENGDFLLNSKGERMPKLGACHTAWAITKRLMLERFGREWKTPQELHPEIIFD